MKARSHSRMSEPTGTRKLKKDSRLPIPSTLILVQAQTHAASTLQMSPHPGVGNSQAASVFGNVSSNSCRERPCLGTSDEAAGRTRIPGLGLG